MPGPRSRIELIVLLALAAGLVVWTAVSWSGTARTMIEDPKRVVHHLEPKPAEVSVPAEVSA